MYIDIYIHIKSTKKKKQYISWEKVVTIFFCDQLWLVIYRKKIKTMVPVFHEISWLKSKKIIYLWFFWMQGRYVHIKFGGQSVGTAP